MSDARDEMELRYEDPIAGVCSKCHANTTAEMDPYEQQPMSVCCWRPLLDPAGNE